MPGAGSARIGRPETRLISCLNSAVVGLATLFVVVNVRPGTWFIDSTPTGGDMGAHVWAPAFLRDVLLEDLRLTGWSQDWYAGFPAFTFYMVLPALFVLLVETGVDLPLGLFSFAGALAAIWCVRDAVWYLARPRNTSRATSAARPTLLRVTEWALVVLIAMRFLDWLDPLAIDLPLLPEVRCRYEPVSRFLAAVVLPVAVGRLVWTARAERRNRLLLMTAAVLATLAVTPVPYGVAFKLVVIAGAVALPVVAFVLGRTAGLEFPGPALMAVATLLFLFDGSYNIYGGNLMSTMAGEFAYSLGLVWALLYMAVCTRVTASWHDRSWHDPATPVAGASYVQAPSAHVPSVHALSVQAPSVQAPSVRAARGVVSGSGGGGRDLVPAAVLLALTGLTHLFAAFLALAYTAACCVLRFRREQLRWVLGTGTLAALLSAWWVLPFFWNRGLLNNMGWGKQESYVSALWSRSVLDYGFLTNDPPLQVFVVLAGVAAVLSLARRVRLGMALAVTTLGLALAFILLPEGRLWNVRLLPFYYLLVYLMAAIGVSEICRLASHPPNWLRRRQARPTGLAPTGLAPTGPPSTGLPSTGLPSTRLAPASLAQADAIQSRRGRLGVLAPVTLLVATCAVLVTVGLSLRSLPGGRVAETGRYHWGPLSTSHFFLGGFWTEYNFGGYEARLATSAGGGWSEYRDLMTTMAEVGSEYGCGRSLWEYEKERLDSYGTPMAPMLLPYHTNRCIGSMEGLYFEASATTPYHFLMQSELSRAPSRAQRDLPYSSLDTVGGVAHLQLMGVRYYLTSTPDAAGAAIASPALTEIAESGPWTVFRVAGSEPVVGLDEMPIVVDGLETSGDGWLEASVGAFLVGSEAPLLAPEGPDDWPTTSMSRFEPELAEARAGPGPGAARVKAMRRMSELLVHGVPRRAVSVAQVSNIVSNDDSISFSVDRLGSPVLVKTSYFPNWSVRGADGPWRVTPNLMVVVPTSSEVELNYGRSRIEWFSILLTLVGFALAVALAAKSRKS